MSCAICRSASLSTSGEGEFSYPGQLCFACQQRAVNRAGVGLKRARGGELGDEAVYVDGLKCWRRYRFGGYVTMRDDTGSETIEEFDERTNAAGWPRDLMETAVAALAESGDAVPSGVGAPLAAGRYRGASFRYRERFWVVCRTALVSSNAQLLDAAVALKEERGADYALAILDPPTDGAGGKMPEPEYVARYRRAALHGLGVVFTTEEEWAAGWRVEPVRPESLSGWLDDFARDFRRALVEARLDIEAVRSSRDAEALVEPICGRLLEPLGFRSASSKSYQSYWRRPAADGVWVREEAASPNRVHLEVKLAEDEQAPFCQVFEGLGIADAVVQVRLVKNAVRERLERLAAKHSWLRDRKARVEERLPIRFLELPETTAR